MLSAKGSRGEERRRIDELHPISLGICRIPEEISTSKGGLRNGFDERSFGPPLSVFS
jgi:hypothetical protein